MTKTICARCGAKLDVPLGATEYKCPYCQAQVTELEAPTTVPTPQSLHVMGTRAAERGEYGRALQFVEQGLSIDPHDPKLLTLEREVRSQLDQIAQLADEIEGQTDEQFAALHEAENYKLQAEFILHDLQANLQVYGNNSAHSGAIPADVDLALRYIDRSLELFSDNPAYLNLKALLLLEGKGDRKSAIALLERAHQISPRDITIEDNLQKARSVSKSDCFVATAVYGSNYVWQIDVLRNWRDQFLDRYALGRGLVWLYYSISPPVARHVARSAISRRLARVAVTLAVWSITRVRKS